MLSHKQSCLIIPRRTAVYLASPRLPINRPRGYQRGGLETSFVVCTYWAEDLAGRIAAAPIACAAGTGTVPGLTSPEGIFAPGRKVPVVGCTQHMVRRPAWAALCSSVLYLRKEQ